MISSDARAELLFSVCEFDGGSVVVERSGHHGRFHKKTILLLTLERHNRVGEGLQLNKLVNKSYGTTVEIAVWSTEENSKRVSDMR